MLALDEKVTEPKRPRILSGVLLLVGTAFLLLLDGQHFTNRVIFLVFVACSGVLWIRFHIRCQHGSSNPTGGRVGFLIHVAVFFVFAVTLPGAYEKQKSFNSAIERIKILNQTYKR